MLLVSIISLVIAVYIFVAKLAPTYAFYFSVFFLFLSFVFLLGGDKDNAEVFASNFFLLNVFGVFYSFSLAAYLKEDSAGEGKR